MREKRLRIVSIANMNDIGQSEHNTGQLPSIKVGGSLPQEFPVPRGDAARSGYLLSICRVYELFEVQMLLYMKELAFRKIRITISMSASW